MLLKDVSGGMKPCWSTTWRAASLQDQGGKAGILWEELCEAGAGNGHEEVEKMNHCWLIPAPLRYLVGCEECVFSLLLVSPCSNLLIKGKITSVSLC